MQLFVLFNDGALLVGIFVGEFVHAVVLLGNGLVLLCDGLPLLCDGLFVLGHLLAELCDGAVLARQLLLIASDVCAQRFFFFLRQLLGIAQELLHFLDGFAVFAHFLLDEGHVFNDGLRVVAAFRLQIRNASFSGIDLLHDVLHLKAHGV